MNIELTKQQILDNREEIAKVLEDNPVHEPGKRMYLQVFDENPWISSETTTCSLLSYCFENAENREEFERSRQLTHLYLQASEKSWEGKEIDWCDGKQAKWRAIYDHIDSTIELLSASNYCSPGVIYFSERQHIKDFFNEHGDDAIHDIARY